MSVLTDRMFAHCKSRQWRVEVYWAPAGSVEGRIGLGEQWHAKINDWRFVYEMGVEEPQEIGWGHGETPDAAIDNALSEADNYPHWGTALFVEEPA